MDPVAAWCSACLAAAPERGLAAGEYLFRRKTAATAIYGVIAGRLRLIRHTTDGRAVTLHVARAGDIFAEAALFAEHYHCDAIADLSSRVAVYAKQPLLEALHRDPAMAAHYMTLQAQRIQRLRALLELRNVRSARERVHQYLCLYADQTSGVLPRDRPLKALASDIGLTHETFYRALAELEKSGEIERGRGVIRLRL